MDELNENIFESEENEHDQNDFSLRPQRINEYLGQEKIKQNLSVYIEAAKKRNEPLDHILLFGPPGLGKTTLANVVGNEMGTNVKFASGPSIEKPGDIVAVLNEIEEGDILFVDEIHRLPKNVEETLYSAMEDYYVDIVLGQGPESRSVRFEIPKFTFIGATTQAGKLSAPLRDRFGIVERLQYYSSDELSQIINRSAKIFNTEIDIQASKELASRSRGTPRIANRLLKRVRDFVEISKYDVINSELISNSLKKLDIDAIGLDENDVKFLTVLIEQFNGGPAGLNAIASTIGESSDTLEEMLEPYLLQIGFLQRTSKGRVATQKAYDHLGLMYRKNEK